MNASMLGEPSVISTAPKVLEPSESITHPYPTGTLLMGKKVFLEFKPWFPGGASSLKGSFSQGNVPAMEIHLTH